MLCLINIYEDILKDFNKPQYLNSDILYRKFVINGITTMIVSVIKKTKRAQISFSIDEYTLDEIKKLPKWKGMEQKLELGILDQENESFLTLSQTEYYESKIYFTILQDIIEKLFQTKSLKVLYIIRESLEKWKAFFQCEKDCCLTVNEQQGLFGELYILQKFLRKHGGKVISCWTGCNSETHDFYLGKDALEVKRSRTKGSNIIHISNEYQLDDSKIIGKLYLMCLKLKKSEVYGQTLPQLVDEISEKISSSEKLIFYDKLLKVGYAYQLPELYNVHFSVSDESCYCVKEGFPRVIGKDLPKGVNSIEYKVNLDICEKYLYEIESYYREVEL